MLIIILLILLDQITKYFFTSRINYGAAFNIFEGYTTLLIIISLVVLIVALYYYFKLKDNKKDKNIIWGLSFLIAGIIGNLLDRIIFGYVRDFIDIGIFPVFNLADTFNFIGVILIIYFSLKK